MIIISNHTRLYVFRKSFVLLVFFVVYLFAYAAGILSAFETQRKIVAARREICYTQAHVTAQKVK